MNPLYEEKDPLVLTMARLMVFNPDLPPDAIRRLAQKSLLHQQQLIAAKRREINIEAEITTDGLVLRLTGERVNDLRKSCRKLGLHSFDYEALSIVNDDFTRHLEEACEEYLPVVLSTPEEDARECLLDALQDSGCRAEFRLSWQPPTIPDGVDPETWPSTEVAAAFELAKDGCYEEARATISEIARACGWEKPPDV